MKKIFFILAFMLLGTMTSENSNTEKFSIYDVECVQAAWDFGTIIEGYSGKRAYYYTNLYFEQIYE